MRFQLIVYFIYPILFFNCKKNKDITKNKESINIPKKLCIYYGYPSLVNNSDGNIEKASDEFANFDLIVLGDGLWKINHPDNERTVKIIAHPKLRNIFFYGYIDIGISTNNYSLDQIKIQIDAWKNMGVKGIFLDDAGNDYGVTEKRRDDIFEYLKTNGLSIFVNAWNPDDVLKNTRLNSNDIYLMESFLIGHGKYMNLNDWESKVEKCLNYKLKNKIQIAAISSGTENIKLSQIEEFEFGNLASLIAGIDYFQFSNYLYSSNNGILLSFKTELKNLGEYWVDSKYLKLGNKYIRKTNFKTLIIEGDGKTFGKAYIQ